MRVTLRQVDTGAYLTVEPPQQSNKKDAKDARHAKHAKRRVHVRSDIAPENPLCHWEVMHVRQGVVALRAMTTGRFLGHNNLGVVQAAAKSPRHWEHLKVAGKNVINRVVAI